MTFKRLLLIGMVLVSLMALPVMAQDTGNAEQGEDPAGITELVIVCGVVAIGWVGVRIFLRENAAGGHEVD